MLCVMMIGLELRSQPCAARIKDMFLHGGLHFHHSGFITGVLHYPFPSVTAIYKFAVFVEVFACVLCRLEFVIHHIGLNAA